MAEMEILSVKQAAEIEVKPKARPMERQVQRKISYTLPLAQNAPAGHRLGIPGLAYDQSNHILYSGGRDGTIFAWRPGHQHQSSAKHKRDTGDQSRTACEAYHQAHTHWINGLTLAHNNEAVISGSSDTTVKLWRPFATDPGPPHALGRHTDYVKAVASPEPTSTWVASGGLDHHIRVWDLAGGKEHLAIPTSDEGSVKGSLYALAAKPSLVASGGTEHVVKLWDPRSGKRASQLIGHTDNVRGILMGDHSTSDLVISCSADQTIKLWSLTAQRCIYNITLHQDSVWCLYSDHPELDVFYSGHRSGVIVKTDVRDGNDFGEGFSIGICQENEGINALVAVDGDIWAATANSSLNRWRDIDKHARFQSLDEARNMQRSHGGRNKASVSSVGQSTIASINSSGEVIPLNSILRAPDIPGGLTDVIRSRLKQSRMSQRRTSVTTLDDELGSFAPARKLPEECIEGLHGLIKHQVLNDKRHVLTEDTAKEVLLWDVLGCRIVKSFGKMNLDDVFKKINTSDIIPQWFESDTRTGALTCTVDEDYCFAGEVYSDQIPELRGSELKEEQRISLGAWVLRYLFADFVHEEVRRDEVARAQVEGSESETDPLRGNVPSKISLPHRPPDTPGFRIGLATPRPLQTAQSESGSTEATTPSQKSVEDYFSSKVPSGHASAEEDAAKTPKAEEPPAASTDASAATSPTKDTSKSFGARLKGTFTPKKSKNAASVEAPAVPQEAEKDLSQDPSTDDTATEGEQMLKTTVDLLAEIRGEYLKQKESSQGARLISVMNPAMPIELPMLKPPPNTSILIQDHLKNGGITDLFEGYVDHLSSQADALEAIAPYWLGDFLLKNITPRREYPKVSFVLSPCQQILPPIPEENGNERLNAHRLLRAKRIPAYIMEKLDKSVVPDDVASAKPEDVLELFCQDQPIPLTMTLLSIRTNLWRAGGDVVILYKPKWDVSAPEG